MPTPPPGGYAPRLALLAALAWVIAPLAALAIEPRYRDLGDAAKALVVGALVAGWIIAIRKRVTKTGAAAIALAALGAVLLVLAATLIANAAA